jgi:hypothetical protein
MQRIRIERKVPFRADRDRYAPLPLDPRDPDILRAKHLPGRNPAPHAAPRSDVVSGSAS